jgi:hypothetical protein
MWLPRCRGNWANNCQPGAATLGEDAGTLSCPSLPSLPAVRQRVSSENAGGPAVPTFERSILINAPRETLFALTQDYSRRLAWDPFLREARLMGPEGETGVGSRAWCVTWYGIGMETEDVSFERPDTAAVRMTRGPWLLASFAGSWRFRSSPGGATRVMFRYHLAARPAWLGPLLNPILVTFFAYDTQRRLEALKAALEKSLPDGSPAGAA